MEKPGLILPASPKFFVFDLSVLSGGGIRYRKDFDGAIKMYTNAADLDPECFEVYADRELDYCNKKSFKAGGRND